MNNYNDIRNEILNAIQFLEQRYTQAEIGEGMTKRIGSTISARDINFLKNLRNKRWKGPAKSEKLNLFYTEIKAFEKKVKLDTNADEQTIKIKSIIRSCLQAEFKLYQQLPDFTTINTLQNWFDKDGIGFKQIQERVQRLTKRKWVINNEGNPSNYGLIEIRIMSVKKDIIKVNTREDWYLKWFGIESGHYEYLYNHCNNQTYTLISLDGEWKIRSIVYDSHQKRQPPPMEALLLTINVKNKEELKSQIENQVHNGNTKRALDIAIQFAKENNIKTLSNKVLVLRNSLIEINRLRNTESITFVDYMDKKNSINEVLLLI